MSRPRFFAADWVIIAVLVAAVAVLYGRTTGFDFVNYDDDQYFFENPHIQGGLTISGIRWAFTSGYASNWHPLTWITHMLDIELFGVTPAGPHGVNAFLHAVNSALLFVVLLRLTGNRWPAALCAALFALHPLRVESVAWISERKDVLSGFFWILTLLAYESYSRQPSAGRYVLVVAAFAGGLLAKPMVVTLPCVLLLLDFWPLKRATDWPSWRRCIIEKIPLMAFSAAASVATYLAQSAGRSVTASEAIGIMPRLLNATVSYVEYLRQSFWPAKLAVFYPHPYSIPGGSISVSHAAVALAILIIISVGAIAVRKRYPWLIVGWLWYLGTLVPVIGLVQVGTQSHADRYTYLPLIGIAIVLAWSAGAIASRNARIRAPFAAAAVAVCVILSVLSWRQIGVWRNSETLMRHAIAVVPSNYAAHNNLGHELDRRGDHAGAEEQYRAVLKIIPSDAIAMNNLAVRLSARGENDAAKSLFRQSIARDSTYAPAYSQLANIIAREGNVDDAIKLYERAIALDPALPEAHHNLAITVAGQGQLNRAMSHWQIALGLKPDYADAHHGYGVALLIVGGGAEGVAELERALAIDPRRVDTLIKLAWVKATHADATLRNSAEALRAARRADELSPQKSIELLDTLAAAHAAAGEFDLAIQHAQAAIALAKTSQNSALADTIAARLQLYRERKPFVQPSGR